MHKVKMFDKFAGRVHYGKGPDLFNSLNNYLSPILVTDAIAYFICSFAPSCYPLWASLGHFVHICKYVF